MALCESKSSKSAFLRLCFTGKIGIPQNSNETDTDIGISFCNKPSLCEQAFTNLIMYTMCGIVFIDNSTWS